MKYKNFMMFAAGFAFAGLLRGRVLKVVRYKVCTDKLKGRLRICLLTDLHSHNYGRGQSKLIRAIESVNPDIICMAGDIADHVIPHGNTKILLRKLHAYPVFYASGNHEFKGGEVREIKAFFREAGVYVLEGECRKVMIRGNHINICGVDDPVIGADTFKRQLRKAAREANNGQFTVLISHRPEKLPMYEKLNFDLILTGHTHGGQIRIPAISNGIFAVNQGMNPKYVGGFYNCEQAPCNMVVSRGLSKSTRGIPRVFNRPELVVVDVMGI